MDMMEDSISHSDLDQSQDVSISGQGDGGKDNNVPKKINIRKRTKTGCITCRKRRIKCDEGRPTCNNCIKSKRHCEGYSQRVIFKEPIGAHPFSGPFDHASYVQGSGHPHPLGHLASQQSRTSGRGMLPNIAPRPSPFDYPGQYQDAPYPSQYHGTGTQPPPMPFDFSQGVYMTPISPIYSPQSQQLNHGLIAPFTSHDEPLQSFDGLSPAFHQPLSLQPNIPLLSDGNTASQMSPIQVGGLAQPQSEFQLVEHTGVDEDLSPGESDDDVENSRALMSTNMALAKPGGRQSAPRSFSAFANSTAVSEYMNFPHASELKNNAQRQIFEHFIRVTGPSMSLYERHPFDPVEREVLDPDAPQGSNIWAYTFPVISFQHPALLNAMLGLASLQLAKLQGNPAAAAMKHYHIAIRRISKNVNSPLRRTHPATLAATLLLGYFEVWNSEHTSWCKHLCGARILFGEIPLREMSRSCLPVKSLRERDRLMRNMKGKTFEIPSDPHALDFGLLSDITGYSITADDYNLSDEHVFDSINSHTTTKDIDDYENLRDLFWWYCKMDVYQSVLGGTKLFMEYKHWTQCPPRAPCSKLETIYGTYDHLILLLGRLANFSAHDTARKRKASRAAGAAGAGGSPPAFTGMIPTHGQIRVPMGFNQPQPSPQADPADDEDPETSFQKALKEWEDLRKAFEAFERHLGREFRPLSTEYSDKRDHPFGPALQYRTFSVAGIWMNLYMGWIHLYRSHPSMPPAALQAVGLSWDQTKVFANQIGRIAVGLSDDCGHVSEISTVLAAALIESAFCMFVAAVQYQDLEQRKWVVRRLYDITRLTGWQSARQIADGCESSWIKAAQLGRGPPYIRNTDYNASQPDFIWHTARRIDRRIQELENSGEERRIVLARTDRTHYALGLLGVEDDMVHLELKDNAFGSLESQAT